MPQEPLPIGTTLQGGEYIIEEHLGGGGFGLTYRANEHRLSRPVAIKEFFPVNAVRSGSSLCSSRDLSSTRLQAAKGQFLEEGRRLAALEHPAIVPVYRIFEENETAYLVMKFLSGTTLATYVEEQDNDATPYLETDAALEVIRKIGPALIYMHERNCLHRDIKPENLFLLPDRSVVLLDFGAAREFLPDRTLAMTFIGTHGFAPPEQYEKYARRGPWTDVYALAATLYFLVTGDRPHHARMRLDDDHLQAPCEMRETIPVWLSDAILQGMSLKPSDRPQSVAEFLHLLNPPITIVGKQMPVVTTDEEREATVTRLLRQVTDSIRREDLTGAERLLDELFLLLPPGEEGREARMRAWSQQASVLYHRGRLPEAEETYRRLLAKVPDNPAGWHGLGIVLNARGNREQAAEAFRTALERDPDSSRFRRELGEILRSLGRCEEAEVVYQAGIDRVPEDADQWNGLGCARYGRGRYQDALQAFDRANNLRPGFAEAYANRGDAQDRLGDTVGATASYEIALKLAPDMAAAHNSRGVLYFREGRYSDAESSFRRAVALLPDFGAAWANLAGVLLLTQPPVGAFQNRPPGEAVAAALNARARGYSDAHWALDVLGT
jgi:serine/threonine protein kinase/Flp pilus assembly protein TadD